MGGESLAVAQNTYAVSWFKGKELNMVFGLQMSFARVGSTVNFNLLGPIYKWMQHYYKGSECLGMVLLIGKYIPYDNFLPVKFAKEMNCFVFHVSRCYLRDIIYVRCRSRGIGPSCRKNPQ